MEGRDGLGMGLRHGLEYGLGLRHGEEKDGCGSKNGRREAVDKTWKQISKTSKDLSFSSGVRT